MCMDQPQDPERRASQRTAAARRRSRRWRRHRPPLWRILTAPFRVLPDFLVIGAQKGGTTSLFDDLVQHPSVICPYTKEAQFFNRRLRCTLCYRGYFPSRYMVWRARRRIGQPVLTGEATPEYLFHPAVPARVHRLLPRARLVVLLRDPIARAFSHYQHMRRAGNEPLGFEEAIAAEPKRLKGLQELAEKAPLTELTALQHYSCGARGIYVTQPRRWLTYYSREQVFIGFSEELFESLRTVFDRVCRFLGLEQWAPRFRVSNSGGYREAISEQTRERLTAFYAPYNRELENLLGCPVPWGY